MRGGGTRISIWPSFPCLRKAHRDRLRGLSQLKVGDFVLAIGYPANIGQSVTSGIASGLHRSNIGIEELENFIQTDAAIYPGNSGGALVNLQDDLVGINTAFIGATNTNPGMGFAIRST
jgi:serine protease DegQ